MRVLLTGASGFVGARVTRQLLAKGHVVAALAEPGDPFRRLTDVLGRIERIEGQLEKPLAARAAIEAFRPEGLIHLAWYAEPGKYLPSPRNLDCLAGSLELLRLLLEGGCRTLVAAGTCAEYDTRPGTLREEGPFRPETLYAASKLSLGFVGAQLAALSQATFAWGRIFYLYGPDEDPRRAIPALMRTLLAGGEFAASEGSQVRDYLHVDDVAGGFVTLLEAKADGVFNVSSGEGLAMREILARAARAVGGEDRVRFGAVPARAWDPPVIQGDSMRLRALGWSPKVTMEAGFAAMADEIRGAGA